MTVSRMARALGWLSVPVPGTAVATLDELLQRLPAMPGEAAWLTAFRVSTLMDSRKAREELGWKPQWDAESTLAETIEGARESGVL